MRIVADDHVDCFVRTGVARRQFVDANQVRPRISFVVLTQVTELNVRTSSQTLDGQGLAQEGDDGVASHFRNVDEVFQQVECFGCAGTTATLVVVDAGFQNSSPVFATVC